MTRKERQLRSSSEEPGPRLNELAELRERLQAELRDLTDAASLADTTAQALAQTGRALDCTAGWSVADILGGGSIISMIKNNELDEALDLASEANQHVSALRQRLTRMPLSSTADRLYADVITRFADISLDNILIDLSVHHQITAARDHIDSLLVHVCDIHAKLTDQVTAAQAELRTAEAERRTLLRLVG
ncbi:hypothetical protein AB0368_07170 [Actinoplanes sp. NPDC051475]|uniref:hypothetical protein n=1 Tax=Actinoplanes sp. NPDC051475 TaxID=3157225 RepID=UPI00344FC940